MRDLYAERCELAASCCDRAKAEVEAAWPGLTAYAQATATASRVLCIDPELTLSIITPTGPPDPETGEYAALELLPTPPPPGPLVIRRNPYLTRGWDVNPLYPMEGETGAKQCPLSEVEHAAVHLAYLYWNRQHQVWAPPTLCLDPLPPSQLKEALEYLRREWFVRGRDPDTHPWPWRYPVEMLELNGPIEEPEATWFSTAVECAYFDLRFGQQCDLATSMMAAVGYATTKQTAALWDWNLYRPGEHPGAKTFEVEPQDSPIAEYQAGLPWPYTAQALTSRRRLLQRAGDLIWDANPAWHQTTSRAFAKTKYPGGEEWTVIAALLDRALEGTSPRFAPDKPSIQQGLAARPDTIPALALWRVLNNQAHLRRCRDCGAWVVSQGRRPVLLCSAACQKRVRRNRQDAADMGPCLCSNRVLSAGIVT